VGRPTLVYSLTEGADALFPDLRCAGERAPGRDPRQRRQRKLHQLLHNVAQRLAAPYRDRVAGKPMPERVQRRRASWRNRAAWWTYGERRRSTTSTSTCPFPKTAERDRAVCALHVDFVRILSGDDARLTRSLLRGERAAPTASAHCQATLQASLPLSTRLICYLFPFALTSPLIRRIS
jgi:predicted ArsR family transcriptional regulator